MMVSTVWLVSFSVVLTVLPRPRAQPFVKVGGAAFPCPMELTPSVRISIR